MVISNTKISQNMKNKSQLNVEKNKNLEKYKLKTD